jgi:hypothetical protein
MDDLEDLLLVEIIYNALCLDSNDPTVQQSRRRDRKSPEPVERIEE